MATELSNHSKYMLGTKNIDLNGDTIKVALMNNSFTFDKDNHATWADVSSSELANGNGYTTGGLTLTVKSIVEDDTNDEFRITYNDAIWTASGGSIGPSNGCIVYDYSSNDKTVIGYLDFGVAQEATDGVDLVIKNIIIRI